MWKTISIEDIQPVYGEDVDLDEVYVDLCNQIIEAYLQEVV